MAGAGYYEHEGNHPNDGFYHDEDAHPDDVYSHTSSGDEYPVGDYLDNHEDRQYYDRGNIDGRSRYISDSQAEYENDLRYNDYVEHEDYSDGGSSDGGYDSDDYSYYDSD